MKPLLEARQVTYLLDGVPIIDGVDLTVHAGETVALTGPSGSGKTTLLALLAGMIQPTGGTILLDGEPLSTPSVPGQGLAVVLQGYGLVSLLTANENVAVALKAAGSTWPEARSRAHDALAEVGLAAHEHHLADELSGGQQQRTAVARALALRPRLLLADEPTAELDPAARAIVISRILDVTQHGTALLLATHDPEVAAQCDRQFPLTKSEPRP